MLLLFLDSHTLRNTDKSIQFFYHTPFVGRHCPSLGTPRSLYEIASITRNLIHILERLAVIVSSNHISLLAEYSPLIDVPC